MLFMSPSSSRNFSRSWRMVSTRVFNRTMRFLMRRILSSRRVVTCHHSSSMLAHLLYVMLMNNKSLASDTGRQHHLQLTWQPCMQAWRKQVKASRNRATDLTVCTVGLLRTGSPALHSSSVIPDSFAQTCRSRGIKASTRLYRDCTQTL